MQKIPKLSVGKAQFVPKGFVADYKTFWFGTNNADEAYYLVSILNSNVINRVIKEHQSRGKFGPRDICRLPFEQNIPLFDSKQTLHKELALLGIQASQEAAKLAKTSRTKIKIAIPSMKKIDELVITPQYNVDLKFLINSYPHFIVCGCIGAVVFILIYR